MPIGALEARCQRRLEEAVDTLHKIRGAAPRHVTSQNIGSFQRLHSKLDAIYQSFGAILLAITKASVTDDTLEDRIMDWLISGELNSCTEELKKVDHMLERSLSGEDKVTAAMNSLKENWAHFHSLLTLTTAMVTNNDEDLHYQPSGAPHAKTRIAKTRMRYPEAAHTVKPTSVPLSSVRQPVIGERKKVLKQRLDEVVRWLAPWNCTEKHNKTLEQCQEGTCKWITNTVVFENWWILRNQFLWLHGKAGCGKSVLAAWIIEDLKSKLRDGEVLVFFYCDFRNKRSTSSTEVMRSILSQLLDQVLDLGRDPEDLPNAIIERKSQGTLPLDDLDQLYKLLSDIVLCFRYEPIIVVDALDECTDMARLLDTLVRLCRVRILVTSRPDPTILNRLRVLPSLSFEDVRIELAKDIDLHVARELDSDNQLRSVDPGLKKRISTELTAKADGRFRWVQCQLVILKQCATTRELRAVLRNLPTELDVMYGNILAEIDERKSEPARRALAWILVASAPLQLSLIADGLSFDREQGKIGSEVERLKQDLLTGLSILVTYSKKTDILELSHFSVKEYLVSAVALPQYRIIPHVTHAEMAQLCMSYVSVFLKRARSDSNVPSLEASPVFHYVLSMGFKHLAFVDPNSQVVLEALKSFDFDIQCHPSYWERLCELREERLPWPYLPWPSSRHDVILYILIAYSTAEVLQSFLSLYRAPKLRVGTNPLVYAADFLKTEHAKTLLLCGAEPRMRGLVMDDSHEALPLEVAIDRGDDTLVSELLKRGSEVTLEILSAAVCLPWCSARVLVELVRTGEFVGWAKKIGDKKVYRSIFSSARPNSGDKTQTDADHVALARRLREVGQDVSADTSFRQELVKQALYAGHTSMLEFLLPPHLPIPAEFLLSACMGDTPETVPVVRFLLNRGVNVHAVSKTGDTALHLAAMCLWEPRSLELTRILIEAGCSPLAHDAHHTTPLTIAVKRGHFLVAEHMLSCVSPGAAMLPLALQQQANPQMIRYLIGRGADVHCTTSDSDRDTVVHLAICGYSETSCFELLETFAEAGSSFSNSNAHGITPLQVATWRRYTSVVSLVERLLLLQNVPHLHAAMIFALHQGMNVNSIQHLVHQGVDIHSTMSDGDSDTVMRLVVASHWETDCLTLLKSFAGCGLTITNSMGRIPWEATIRRGYTSVVEWLLSWNIPLDRDVLLFAIQGRVDSKMVKVLLRGGADVHCATPEGDTVIHLAIGYYWESASLDLLMTFAKAGCSLTTANSEKKTPLDVAIRRGYDSVVEWLRSRLKDTPIATPPPRVHHDTVASTSISTSESATAVRPQAVANRRYKRCHSSPSEPEEAGTSKRTRLGRY